MKITNLKKLILILSMSVLLQGCVAALIGGGAVATKVGTDPRTVGTQIDDETLEFKIEDALQKDQQIAKEARIEVVSYNSRILLIGQVPNDNLKDVATNITKGVQGVSEIYNELRIGQQIGLGTISKDSWITSQVKSKMLLDSQVKSTDIKVITENAEVFLLGDVTSSQADASAEIASRISGVAKVVKVFKYTN